MAEKRRPYKKRVVVEIDMASYQKAVQLSELAKDFFDYVLNNFNGFALRFADLYHGMDKLDFSKHTFLGLAHAELSRAFTDIYQKSSGSMLVLVQDFFPGKNAKRMVCLCAPILLSTEVLSEKKNTILTTNQRVWQQIYNWVVAEFTE